MKFWNQPRATFEPSFLLWALTSGIVVMALIFNFSQTMTGRPPSDWNRATWASDSVRLAEVDTTELLNARGPVLPLFLMQPFFNGRSSRPGLEPVRCITNPNTLETTPVAQPLPDCPSQQASSHRIDLLCVLT